MVTLTVHSRTPDCDPENSRNTSDRSCGRSTHLRNTHMETLASRGRAYLLFHVAMETQEAEETGRGLGQDGAEEKVEEVDGFAAGDEHDDLVVLRELKEQAVRSPWQPAFPQQRSHPITLHWSRMKAARQTSRTLLGTTTTNCFRASGTAKLSDWLTGLMSEEAEPETLMLTGSFKQTSTNRVTPGVERRFR